MLRKVVDISSEGLFLYHRRGFLFIEKDKLEVGRIPLDDIAVLVLSAQGVTITKDILCALIKQGSVVVLCGEKYYPETVMTPLFGNYEFTGRLITQINSSLPLKKRLWQSIIKEKIRNQAELLESLGNLSHSVLLKQLADSVLSGDTTNREAYSAREYWAVVFGKKFYRNQDGGDMFNNYLNYGYAVLRALVARSVCAAGLHPSLGLFHHNELDNMCLVDDLMEPFRVIVDWMVIRFCRKNKNDQMIEWKKTVIHNLPDIKVTINNTVSKLSIALDAYANSLHQSFVNKENCLCIPKPILS